MEEEKAAAYYDELTRKGGGAARFKQGLGFSSNQNDDVPDKASALPSSSSSFLSSFVKASSPNSPDVQKQAQIESIQNKLNKKRNSSSSARVSDENRNSLDLETDRRNSRRRSRSRDRDERSRNRRRSRSRSRDRDERLRNRNRRRSNCRDRDRSRRKRSRSVSPRYRKSEKKKDYGDDDKNVRREKNVGVDYAKLIQGYDKMSPAERVKAKMKLQLSATAKQDEANGMGAGWERFKFDKDAPLDDEEIEAADDDGDLVKHIGQTFRFSAVEARREEKIKATHDEAIFGTTSLAPPVDTDSEAEGNDKTRDSPETAPVASLISDQVRSLQQGSWRDRIRKP